MAAIDCARAILKYISDIDTAVTLVAIAGAESSWREDAAGDRFGGYWSCDGYQSWGPWQINIDAHHSWLVTLVGSSNPCDIARWLSNYDNNALAAATILARQGLCAWTVYEEWCGGWPHNGRYRSYLDQAREAVNTAIASGGGTGGTEIHIPGETAGISPLHILLPLGVLVLGASGTGLLVLWHKGASISDMKDALLRRIRHGR